MGTHHGGGEPVPLGGADVRQRQELGETDEYHRVVVRQRAQQHLVDVELMDVVPATGDRGRCRRFTSIVFFRRKSITVRAKKCGV